MVELHFSLIFLLKKLHFSLFWLLGKLHFFLIPKFRGVLPSYYRKWRNGETENARKDALKYREGERLNGSHQRLFTVPVRPKVKAFFAMPRLQGGAKEAKFVPLCTKKGRQQKNIKRNRARGARFHLSYLYVFQGYMHFLQTLHSSGLKFDNQKGLVCRVWSANPTRNPTLCRVLRRSV